MAGIVRGMLCAANFPATVTAHLVATEVPHMPRTVFVVRFEPHVIERDKLLSAS